MTSNKSTARPTGPAPRYQATTKEAFLALVIVRRSIRQIVQALDSADRKSTRLNSSHWE